MSPHRPAALAVAFVVALALAATPLADADGAGRRGYGGRVALPVADYAGLTDPHSASTRSQRLQASLVHCRLVRPDGPDRFRGELARDLTWRGRTLTVTLVDGARFHDGHAARATDVVASLRRLGQLDDRSPWAPLFAALVVREVDPLRLTIVAPRGAKETEVMALLARPEAAVLRGGRPGAGCGPFRVASGDGGGRRLEPFEGHPEGRPWLDVVELKRVSPGEAEQAAFSFGDVDVTFEDAPRTRRAGTARDGGLSTFFAIPHPRLRGGPAGDVRRAVAALARGERLARYVEGRAASASAPWPPALAPSAREIGQPTRAERLPSVTVAYREGDRELGDLARALRDSLRRLTSGSARVIEVAGLDASAARGARDPSWDIAVVRHDWAAATVAQAAVELAFVHGVAPPSPEAALGGTVRSWADRVIGGADAVAILHLERPLLTRTPAMLGADGDVPDLSTSWLPR